MERFVARENIRRFRERLHVEKDAKVRLRLLELIAEQEKKLAELEPGSMAAPAPTQASSDLERRKGNRPVVESGSGLELPSGRSGRR